jgi:hypothetical protein
MIKELKLMELMERIILGINMERIMEIRSIHHMYQLIKPHMYPHINPRMVVVEVECFRSSMDIHSIRHLRILLRHQLDILIKLQLLRRLSAFFDVRVS